MLNNIANPENVKKKFSQLENPKYLKNRIDLLK